VQFHPAKSTCGAMARLWRDQGKVREARELLDVIPFRRVINAFMAVSGRRFGTPIFTDTFQEFLAGVMLL
jgi:hypothetical protein